MRVETVVLRTGAVRGEVRAWVKVVTAVFTANESEGWVETWHP